MISNNAYTWQHEKPSQTNNFFFTTNDIILCKFDKNNNSIKFIKNSKEQIAITNIPK